MNKNTLHTDERTRRSSDQLDQRYGAIGISAVAAAVRYQSEGKNMVHARNETAPGSRERAEAEVAT
jgi:hypothetical protein